MKSLRKTIPPELPDAMITEVFYKKMCGKRCKSDNIRRANWPEGFDVSQDDTIERKNSLEVN